MTLPGVTVTGTASPSSGWKADHLDENGLDPGISQDIIIPGYPSIPIFILQVGYYMIPGYHGLP
jgi:hypothetical protein